MRKNIKVNIIIILIIIIKYTKEIILEYKRDIYKEKNEKFYFTEFFKNYISTKLCFGSNKQCLKLNIELNSYPLWLITAKSKTSKKKQISFDQFLSETFYLKDTSTHVYYHSKFQWTYYCYDSLSFQKNFLSQLKRNKIINNYYFYFIYNKFNNNNEKIENGDLLIGELPDKYLNNLFN